MKTRVIKSERVQKMVINDIYNKMCYANSIFNGEYDVQIEDADESYRKVVFAPEKGSIINDFISATAVLKVNELVEEVQQVYPQVFWCIATRLDITQSGHEYHKAVIEIHVPIKK